MYTVIEVELRSVEKPTLLILKTEEEFEVNVEYRYGHMMVSVNDELLHKAKLTTDFTDSKMSQEDIIDYLKEYLPEELLTFSLTKIKKNGTNI